MRKLGIAVLASVIVLLLSPALSHFASPAFIFEACSCTAKDNSCSVSISCQGGCTKFCGDNDNCHAECSGLYEVLGMEVTLEMQNGNYSQVVAELARVSGKELTFSPTKPDMLFKAGFKKAALWDALKLLSDHGTVRVQGQDFEKFKRLRRTLLSGERISFGVKNTPVNTFVNDIASLTGLRLHIIAGRPTATVNVELQDASLSDILNTVAEQTGTKIIEEGADPGDQ